MSLLLQDLSKTFNDRGTTHDAVTRVSLEFSTDRFYTLLGPSGCGKTTLLRLIAGFEQPTSGAVLYNGRNINTVPPYERGFPMVFQSYALFPHLTVAENVAYGLKIKKQSMSDVETKVARALDLLELTSQSRKHPAQLSGGQQQRVALARAIVVEPELILLDEPLSNLDAGLRIAMRHEVRELQKRLGITAIYVTHDQEEALAVSDEIVVMNEGRVEQTGTPRELYNEPQTEFVARFMGNPNIFRIVRNAAGEMMLLGMPYALESAQATSVAVPSEAIEINAEGRHCALVESATFLGARIQYALRLGAEVLIIDRASDAEEITAGSEVRFNINPAKTRLL